MSSVIFWVAWIVIPLIMEVIPTVCLCAVDLSIELPEG